MKNIINTCLKTFKTLCTPAQLYFVLSTLSFLLILLQNCSDGSSYKIGTMKVKPECHNVIFFIFKAAYILGFTYLLNWFCGKKLKTISWIIVLLPFIAMFLILGVTMISIMSSRKEGFKEGADDDDDAADDQGENDDEDNDDEDDNEEEEEDDDV
tara:strand:+ start:1618 stop:2082 length:465 start_codon:yes stop_codon:yes gene_type:complete